MNKTISIAAVLVVALTGCAGGDATPESSEAETEYGYEYNTQYVTTRQLPRLESGDMRPDGRVAPEKILNGMRDAYATLAQCKRQAGAEGGDVLMLRFVVSSDGQVLRTEEKASAPIANPGLTACTRKIVEGLVFPPSDRGGAIIEMPLDFSETLGR